MNFDPEIQHSVSYLNSDEALGHVDADAYWPKWHSPWWHMLLLHEMGETARIPEHLLERYVAKLNRIPVKIFPIHPEDMPDGVDPFRGSPCHCQLGNVYQVLAARGVDVDAELPWLRPWFLKYQMPDGGLNCDNDAYLVKDEHPSSMVGTIAVFEAVLLYTNRPWTTEERKFLEQGAKFLISRELRHGSPTVHNASERESAKSWGELCFPRYYLYDVLRGLGALTLWAEKTGGTLPRAAVAEVLRDLKARFPDGRVKTGRLAYAGAGTLLPTPSGEWLRGHPAALFPLLQKTSAVGEVSPFLTRQWADVQRRLERIAHG